MTTILDVYNLAQQILDAQKGFSESIKLSPAQIVAMGLSDISKNLGVIRAGDFLALSTGTDPLKADATGTFMSALGKVFGAKTYHLGGVHNGTLQWGVNSITGELEAGAGSVVLSASGISSIAGLIGGWTIAADKLSSGLIALNSATPSILMGSATDYLTGTGYFMGLNGGVYKMHLGNPAAGYLAWDGNALITTGQWITGNGLNTSLQRFTCSCAFTSASDNQVNWSSGVLKTSGGNTYNITAGNTGAMTALSYIYLDVAISSTVLQVTTTYSTAVGDGKILVASAQNHTAGASFLTFYGQQPVINGDQITAASILAGTLAADSVVASNINVSQLDAISANLGLATGGEFRVGTGTPGSGFTGGRFGYPGFSYGGQTYFLVGVNNDVLQIGLNLSTGQLLAGAGAVTMDEYGILMSSPLDALGEPTDTSPSSIKFIDLTGGSAYTFGHLYGWVSPADGTRHMLLYGKDSLALRSLDGGLALTSRGFSLSIGSSDPLLVSTTAITPLASTRLYCNHKLKPTDTGEWNTLLDEALYGDITFYVRPDGDDSNSGLADTAAEAFLTIQHAINHIREFNIWFAGSATIQIADGTYTSQALTLLPVIGHRTDTRRITIQGNASTPSSVILSSTMSNDLITVDGDAGFPWKLKNLKLVSTNSTPIYGTNGAVLEFENLEFGASSGYPHISVDKGARITATGNYTISGGASNHWKASSGGIITVQGKTITISGTPAFSGSFASVLLNGLLVVDGNTFSGSATGVRFAVTTDGVLYTNGTVTYLPGNAAGTYDYISVPVSTAASDLLVGDGSGWLKKTLSEAQEILNLTPSDGWVPVSDSWSYASAYTVTVPSGAASRYSVGDKVKFTQTSVKYFNIIAVADTVLTLTGGSDYTVANAAISAISYSKSDSPVGFPTIFNLTAPTFTTNGTPFTNQPTVNAWQFSMNGKTVTVKGVMQNHATSGGAGLFIATFTSAQIPYSLTDAVGSAYNLSNSKAGYCYVSSTNSVINMALYDGTTIATNSQYYIVTITYFVG